LLSACPVKHLRIWSLFGVGLYKILGHLTEKTDFKNMNLNYKIDTIIDV
jgi:hypothetical protein